MSYRPIITLIMLLLVSCAKHTANQWTVVCDEKGKYNFTVEDGEVNPYIDPYNSYYEAKIAMDYLKDRQNSEPIEQPKRNWVACPTKTKANEENTIRK